MALGQWFSQQFGSEQRKGSGPQAAYGQAEADVDKQRLQGMGAGFAGRGAIQADAGPQAADYGEQQKALGLMQGAAEGNAPSAAALQMQAGTDASVRAQMAGAAGARGGGANQALAGLNAASSAGQAQQANVGATGQLRAQEMAAARGAYGQMATGMRGQSQQFALGQGQLALGSRSANDQAQLNAEQLGQGYQGQAVQGDITRMNAESKMNSENAANNQANGAGVIGGLGKLAGAAFMASDAAAKRGIHDLEVDGGLGAGIYDSYDRRPTLAHTITIADPHGPTVHIQRHGGPHPGMRFGGKSPGRPGVDAPWDEREYDVASGNSWRRDAQVEPVTPPPPPPAWWGTHRTPASLAQQMTDEASRGHTDPAGSQAAIFARQDREGARGGIDAEFREAAATPGSGRYRDMGPTESRLEEIADLRRKRAEAAEEERLAVDRRIGSPRIISSGDAKMDISDAGGADSGGGGGGDGGGDSGGGGGGGGDEAGNGGGRDGGSGAGALSKTGQAVGRGMEEFGRVAGKQGGGDVGKVDDASLRTKPLKFSNAPAGGTAQPRAISDENAKTHKRGLGFSEAITQSARSGIREAPVPEGEHPDYATYYDDSGQLGPHHTPHSQFLQRVAFHYPTAAKTITSDARAKAQVHGLGEKMKSWARDIDDSHDLSRRWEAAQVVGNEAGGALARHQHWLSKNGELPHGASEAEPTDAAYEVHGRGPHPIFEQSQRPDAITSDSRSKRGIAPNPMVHFLEAIHPYSYEYKDGRDDTMGQQGAHRVGIIAQEANADPVGHTMIERTLAPDGKKRLAVNMGAGLSVALASTAALQEEIDALKAHLGLGSAHGRR